MLPGITTGVPALHQLQTDHRAAAPQHRGVRFSWEVRTVAQIYLPTPLRRLTSGQARIVADGRTVEEALIELERRYPGLREQLREPTGEVRRFINVFVNGTEIRTLQGPATPIGDGDEVSIVPAMAGGMVD
jgi:molybdopterin synthase sulfur carrier subunit